MKKLLLLSFLCLSIAGQSQAKTLLQSGPMIGYSTMSETMVWVQTTEVATVSIEYWKSESPKEIFSTDSITTEKKNAYIAKCIADQVKSGSEYHYRVLINGKTIHPQFREGYKTQGNIPLTFKTPTNWRFRESGHEIFDFTIGFGSCAYINQEGGYDRLKGPPYGGKYQIFESIYEVDPDAFIWLGDNVYLREPDWTSRTGIHQRWTHDRSIPEMRAMLANIPNYSIWDDHDYGPNDSGWQFWNKAETTRAFKLFSGNASAGLPELPGIFSFFNLGDANVYLLDNRTHRTPSIVNGHNSRPRQMLGKAQIDWLVETMKYRQGQAAPRQSYPASFNIVCVGNQVLSGARSDNLPNYPEEWNYLFDRLTNEKIGGVVFLTGDVHFSEVNKKAIPTPNGNHAFLEITSSPLTSGSWAGVPSDENPNRLDVFPGEMDRVGERNFSTISFSGPLNDRSMTIRFYNSDGVLLNQKPGAPEGEVTDSSIIKSKDLAAPQQ